MQHYFLNQYHSQKILTRYPILKSKFEFLCNVGDFQVLKADNFYNDSKLEKACLNKSYEGEPYLYLAKNDDVLLCAHHKNLNLIKASSNEDLQQFWESNTNVEVIKKRILEKQAEEKAMAEERLAYENELDIKERQKNTQVLENFLKIMNDGGRAELKPVFDAIIFFGFGSKIMRTMSSLRKVLFLNFENGTVKSFEVDYGQKSKIQRETLDKACDLISEISIQILTKK